MPKSRTILIAEDNPDDVFFLKRAFIKAGIDNWLCFVGNGQEAISYLSGIGCYSDRSAHPVPRLLLLDLQMPVLDGFEVLQCLKQQPTLKRLPVIMFSSSPRPEDVNRAYDLGANSYVVKTTDFETLVQLATDLNGYWLNMNVSPDIS